jgi:hypothetical protein
MKQKDKRKANALARLETQLTSGAKTEKGTTSKKVNLTEADKNRISKEINILKKTI